MEVMFLPSLPACDAEGPILGTRYPKTRPEFRDSALQTSLRVKGHRNWMLVIAIAQRCSTLGIQLMVLVGLDHVQSLLFSDRMTIRAEQKQEEKCWR